MARHPLDMAVSLSHRSANLDRRRIAELPGVMRHLSDAWRRRHEDNALLVHYDDLRRDLPGQVRGLAARLRPDVPEEAMLGPEQLARHHARTAELAPEDLLARLHRSPDP